MSSPLLVTYATRGGSTGEVAQAIGAALEQSGLTTEVKPVSEATSLLGKSGVILGAPLYLGSFPKEFHQFIRHHRKALESVQAWCFVVGPTRREAKDFDAARTQAMKQLGAYPWLRPADVHIFGGRWDMNTIPFPFSLVRRIPGNPLAKIPAEDIRDWTEIREWAAGIAAQLHPAAAQPAIPVG